MEGEGVQATGDIAIVGDGDSLGGLFDTFSPSEKHSRLNRVVICADFKHL